jgi:uncharacterized protein (DUF1330 family)
MKTRFTVGLSILTGITVGAVAVQYLHAQAKPPAYVIGEIDVADQDGYAKEYLPASAKMAQDSSVKILARGTRTVAIKGEPPKRIVLFAFENFDRAQATFTSPAFLEANKIGEKYAKFRIFLVEGLSQ